MLNKNLLISKMKLYGDTQESLANHIGLSVPRVNAKINGTAGAEFSQSEIVKIKEKYNLSDEDVIQIFFVNDVSF